MPREMAPPNRNIQEKFDDRKILRSAIKTATRERLAKVLLELLDNADDGTASILESRLLTTKVSKRLRADSTGQPLLVKKRKKLYEICIQCEKEYNVEENKDDSCQWHPEEAEPDYESDFWADHDERCHGRIDDLGDECPEGFMYICCDKDGTAPGCEISKHRSKP